MKAPAKINIRLEVLGKRRDGYHEIRTLFQAVDLCDRLTLERIPSGIELISKNRSLPRDHRNLCVLAARRLLASSPKKKLGVRITLDKKIPIAAGLGGGSSDAAATLKGLVRLWDLKISHRRLMRVGASLGSDVPFFLCGHGAAWGRGRGERLTPVKQGVSFWTLVVTPPIHIRTKDIYSYIDPIEHRLTRPRTGARMRSNTFRALSDIISLVSNDLQQVTVTREPAVGKLVSCLRTIGARGVGMSGSGPSVFALFPHREDALRTCNRLRRLVSDPTRLFLARTL